jgi:opacity protein-like surface antigen
LADLKGDHQNNFLSDEAFPNVTSTTNQSLHLFTRVTDLATIAGRIGLVANPLDRTLFYAKGGAAFVRNKYSATSSVNVAQCVGSDCVTFLDTGSFSNSQTRWGWMAGVGLEHNLFDNISATIEYDYMDFGSKTVNLPGTVHSILIQDSGTSIDDFAGTRSFKVNQNIHVIKFGLNYRFGGFGP